MLSLNCRPLDWKKVLMSPYFQSARALRLKGLYNQNSFKYNFALKVTAAHNRQKYFV
jgi:hypothetical protein